MPKYTKLDPDQLGASSTALRDHLQEHVIGQAQACEVVVGALAPYFAQINPPNKPLCTLLFLGSTGIGKTYCVEEMARHLCGTTDAVTRISCETLRDDHSIYSLIGSPSGYVGYNDTPRLAQRRLNAWRKTIDKDASIDGAQLSILLFDEIDKASYAVLQLLLGILETGHLTLSNGDEVDFSQTIVVLTANWGGRKISDANSDNSMGFVGTHAKPNTDQLAIAEANKAMSPELQNRIDKIVVFKNLDKAAIQAICQLEIGKVQKTVRDSALGFIFSVSNRAQQALCAEGVSPKFGARELKRVINRRVTQKLANIIASGQVHNSLVKVDYLDGEYVFVMSEISIERICRDEPETVLSFVDKPLPPCPVRLSDDEPILSDGYAPI